MTHESIYETSLEFDFSLMAFFGRRDVVQAFRNNYQFQQFILTGVTPTGTVLGTGSYGTVEEVKYSLLL